NGTQAAVALTKLPIGDLGIVAAKQMFYRAQFRTAGLCCGGLSNQFGFYLTTNKTLPTQLGYDPRLDSSVSLLVMVQAAGGGNFNAILFAQRNIGETIASEDTGGCSPASSCFASGTININPATTNVTLGAVLNYTTQGNLNFGCIGSVGGPGCSELALGPGTSVPPTVNAWTQQIPWFRFQAEQY